jgi:hypothetical protein
MNEREKSDSPVVPAKPPNKSGAAVTEAEVVEERGLAKGNTDSTTRSGHSAGLDVSSGLDRVREVARRDKDARFSESLTECALQRHYSRQEPSAVVPHAGICAGGRSKERSLPRSYLSRRAPDVNRTPSATPSAMDENCTM